jgi:lauroyl/myristoyl acyltransferase
MCQRFIENREKFIDLVFSSHSFTMDQIVEEFRKQQDGDILIDGTQSIPELLEELRENGALRYSKGKYLVTEDPYAAPSAALRLTPSGIPHE